MQFPLLSKIGVALVVLGILGYMVIFPSFMAIDGKSFSDQLVVDANGVETFGDYDSGDTVLIIDTIARMQFDAGQTFVWVESIGKTDSDVRFIFSQDLRDDFGVGSEVVITFEVENSGQSESVVNEEISTRPSTMFDYIFIMLTVAGFGLTAFGFVKARRQPSQPVLDDWGAPVAPAAPPTPVAPPPSMAPGVPPSQPQAPPSMAAIPETPVAPPPAAPTTMTITVPPGVLPGQVLTVTMPNGQVVNVQVPPGSVPGSQFTISVTQ